MRRDTNRVFFFVETQNPDTGSTVIRVGSDFAPMWGQEYTTLADAMEAVKRRNKGATGFREIKNGVIAEYQ